MVIISGVPIFRIFTVLLSCLLAYNLQMRDISIPFLVVSVSVAMVFDVSVVAL